MWKVSVLTESVSQHAEMITKKKQNTQWKHAKNELFSLLFDWFITKWKQQHISNNNLLSSSIFLKDLTHDFL